MQDNQFPMFWHKGFFGSVQLHQNEDTGEIVWYGRATSKKYPNIIVKYEAQDIGSLFQEFFTQVDIELEVNERN